MKEAMNEDEMMMVMRSASDKERTKMRERQRRSITTKIFQGLRKHGGYNLPPRSDINDVLRELAREAGWVVEPDGTTYRAPSSSTSTTPNVTVDHVPHYHSCCFAGKTSKTTTPTSSFGGGGGDCSTTASPRHVAFPSGGPNSLYLGAGGYGSSSYHHHQQLITPPDHGLPVALYCGIGLPCSGILNGGAQLSTATGSTMNAGDAAAFSNGTTAMMTRQQVYFTESRAASNENSPVDSPQRGHH